MQPADRIQETTSTSGTGPVTLAGAKAKHRAFSAAYSVGAQVSYCIESQTSNQWEVGVGRLTSGNTLARLTVTSGSNGANLVNLDSSIKNVFATTIASQMNNLRTGSPHGACKWFGASVSQTTVNRPTNQASAYRATYGMLLIAEAPFYAVQLVYVNTIANALSGIKALVGVTETISTATAGNHCKPVIGGTTYGQIAPAGSVNGFRNVTWSGNSTLSLGTAVTNTTIGVSDVIPLSSIPRADVTNALPAFIFRLDHDPATGGNFPFVVLNTAMRTATAANRGRVVIGYNVGFDAVANPNQNMALATDMHQVFPIFHYAVPSLTVLVAGDSIEQNDGLVADAYSSWGWRGCADASTTQRPINYVNMGASSRGSPEFWARAQELMNAGVVPDVLVIAPASVNDGYVESSIARLFSDHKARTLDILRYAKQKGIKHVFFIPLMPYNALNANQDTYRKDFNDWLRTLGYPVMAFDALGNGAAPERWTTGMNADDFHPNENAIETIMAPQLTAMLNTVG